MERGEVVIASSNVESIVTAGTSSSTLEVKYNNQCILTQEVGLYM